MSLHFFCFKQKTAYEIMPSLVGSENVYKRQELMSLFICWVVMQWLVSEVFDKGVCDELDCVVNDGGCRKEGYGEECSFRSVGLGIGWRG